MATPSRTRSSGCRASGTLGAVAGDRVVYTPAPGFAGTDTFTYRASDGEASSNLGTVTITVIASTAPVAQDQTVSTAEDTPVAITLVATDPNGDPLTYAIVDGPTRGVLSGQPPAVTYTPNLDTNGLDSFTFKASDGVSDSNVATVTIDVQSGTDPPSAIDQGLAVSEDGSLAMVLTGFDPDGDPLTFRVVTEPLHGTLTGTAPNLIYAPALHFYGPDQLTFVVNDGTSDSNAGTIGITVTPVNDAPVADDVDVSTLEDTDVSVTLTASDVDVIDTLSFIVVSAPASGQLLGTPPTLTYRPAPDAHGVFTFTFAANDGLLDSNEATVTITVTPVNDVPVAQSRSLGTDEDVPLPITLEAIDGDGDALSYAIVAPPSLGTLSGTAPSLTYTPLPNQSGEDSFTFRASDGASESNLATVSITIAPVNDPPVATNQSVSTRESQPVLITLTATDVEGDALSFTIESAPAQGTLSGAAPIVTYTPAAGFSGSDAFTFRASDG